METTLCIIHKQLTFTGFDSSGQLFFSYDCRTILLFVQSLLGEPNIESLLNILLQHLWKNKEGTLPFSQTSELKSCCGMHIVGLLLPKQPNSNSENTGIRVYHKEKKGRQQRRIEKGQAKRMTRKEN